MFDKTKTNGGAVTNLDFASGGSPPRRWRLDAAGEGYEGGGYYFSAAKSNTLPPRAPPTLQKSYHVVPAKLLLRAAR